MHFHLYKYEKRGQKANSQEQIRSKKKKDPSKDNNHCLISINLHSSSLICLALVYFNSRSPVVDE